MKKRAAQSAFDIERMPLTKKRANRIRQILAEMPQRDQELLRAIFLEETDKDVVCRKYEIEQDYLRVLVRRAKTKFSELYNGEDASQPQPLRHAAFWRKWRKSLLQLNQRGSSVGKNIVRPPGSFLRRVSEFLFSPKTIERVVSPIISDMQVEYCQALEANFQLKAAWVCLRGYWSFFKAIGLYSIMKTLVEMWRKVSSV